MVDDKITDSEIQSPGVRGHGGTTTTGRSIHNRYRLIIKLGHEQFMSPINPQLFGLNLARLSLVHCSLVYSSLVYSSLVIQLWTSQFWLLPVWWFNYGPHNFDFDISKFVNGEPLNSIQSSGKQLTGKNIMSQYLNKFWRSFEPPLLKPSCSDNYVLLCVR